MAEPHPISALKAKSHEIERYIRESEKRLAQARIDLVHVKEALRLMSSDSVPSEAPVYISMAGRFQKGEVARLAGECLAASQDGTAGTRDITRYVMAAKDWDASDRTLVRALSFRVSHALTYERRAGRMALVGRRKGVNVWRALARP